MTDSNPQPQSPMQPQQAPPMVPQQPVPQQAPAEKHMSALGITAFVLAVCVQ